MFNFYLGLSFSNLVFLKVFVFSLSYFHYFLDLVIVVLQLKQKNGNVATTRDYLAFN